MNNSFVFYVPKSSPVGDLLAALVYFGRPVVGYVPDENGAEVTIMAQAQDSSAYMGYARAHGLVKPVAAKPVAPPVVIPPTPAAKPNVFDTVDLNGLMKTQIKNIQAWVTEHAAFLTEHDVKSMIIWEQDQKKPRVNLIKGLKALVGGEA